MYGYDSRDSKIMISWAYRNDLSVIKETMTVHIYFLNKSWDESSSYKWTSMREVRSGVTEVIIYTVSLVQV